MRASTDKVEVSVPHRGHGLPDDWALRRAGVYQTHPAPSGGSTFMRGMLGGIVCDALGLGSIHGNIQRYEVMLAHAEKQVTAEALQF